MNFCIWVNFVQKFKLLIMKKSIILLAIISLVYSCGNNNPDSSSKNEQAKSMVADPSKYDPHRGEGKHTAIELGEKLDVPMAELGAKIQSVKCYSCHKLTDEKLVGPGWKGVTTRRKPEWIMNFITNPDPMIDKDPVLQAQLELCLVRMPNQGLTDTEAREVLEFMRKNDGVK